MSEKDTVEWATWTRIKARCYQPSHNNYPRYGARGITVCERWRSSYDAFLADMGRRPTTPGRWSIDRINNDGPYAPWNCRWATHSQQQRNRSYRGNCGEGNGSAKLTEAQVVQIRAVAKPGLFSQLARQFKVSAPTITDIARGRTWRLVKASPEAIHADCKRERDELQQALERVVNAFDRCDSNRGRFSTVGQHDTRCPKGRVDSPDKWRGEWVCACGAEELDEAIEAARKLTSPEARATGDHATS